MRRIARLLGRLLLAGISWPALSRLYGRLTRLRRPRAIALWMIRRFRDHYRIAMDEFQGDAGDYRSLSEFFLRPLDPLRRPLATDESCLLSPADGRLSELEFVSEDRATQVKGWSYPLSLLLAANVDGPRQWLVATIYLSPGDYHRFHYPAAARVTGSFHGGTRLFPVNGFSVSRVRRLYVRNERVVTRFSRRDTTFYMVAVGATFVGSIGMKHLPAGTPARNRWQELDVAVGQMEEMGHFAMGSTIILVFPAAGVEKVLATRGQAVRAGEPLLRIRG